VVIDPQRDIDRVLDLAGGCGVRITDIFETHLHNDYVTGGLALAREIGAAYHVAAADPVAFDRVPVRDGDVLEASPSLRVRAVATTGHTFTHLSYVLEAPGQPPAVFTGGSLLYGSTGRPDLLGAAYTAALARAQYASAHRLAEELPESTEVYPTHGFGSFCSATQFEGDASTIGQERRIAARRHRPLIVLDVRRNLEWAQSHIDGAIHIPLHQLPARLSEVPGGEVWVHCGSGYRASILDAAGRTIVAVNDHHDHAAGAGLPLISGDTQTTAA
jgi:glyoxylase-like metal-dependent hydrolase (beta-lactamase superfamily II)